MKRYLLYFILIIIYNPSLFSEERVKLYIAYSEGKFGYIDSNGKTKIPFKFQSVTNFRGKFARVEIDNKYHFIDKSGKEYFFDNTYQADYLFDSEGYMIFESLESCYLVNENFEKIFPAFAGRCEEFGEGLMAVQFDFFDDSSYGYFNPKGNSIKGKFDCAKRFSEGKAAVCSINKEKVSKIGFIDHNGKFVIDPIFDIPLLEDQFGLEVSFSESRAKVFSNKIGKFGYINEKGILAIDYKYLRASHFSEGLAVVSNPTNFNKQEVKEYIDKNGKVIISVMAIEAYPFKNGIARIKELPGKYYWINKKGKREFEINLQNEFIEINDFDGDLAFYFSNNSNESGYVNRKGMKIFTWTFTFPKN
ncbi:WG repeat-containing protein [Leptospira sp. GIMC2001]|uniref:WG repeat-containing protein n=1 Tax=Leptospira sp. GIMC2001 TaxID=1513297 RepID=UPI00234A8E1E|nr:WG repeat-containing protein [Leptospira sp. GIMC2001]WCL51032.1 WG repeat-containing protein [Leptospira sp. GIMC2001]